MASKRKLDVKSLETKYQAISEAERGGSKKAVAEKFGIPPGQHPLYVDQEFREDQSAIPPMKPPTDVEAQEMCDKLRLYIQAKAGGEDLFTGINKVADFAKKSSQKELIQPKLFSFFK